MHILYYFEPWIELSRPELRYHNVRYQMLPQARGLIESGHTITFLMGDSTYYKCLEENLDFGKVEVKIILQTDLKKIFKSYNEATISLAKHSISGEKEKILIKLYESILKDVLVPNVIISFLTPASFFNKIYNEALLLYTEFGIFSRAPFPRSFYFDPFGLFKDSFLRQYEKELKSLVLSSSEEEELYSFRKAFLYEGINLKNPFKYLNLDPMSKFDKIFLLPLQFSNYFGFDAYSNYDSQFDFLMDILEKVPKNIGILVTEHNGWEPVITEHNLNYLQNNFDNFIYKPDIYSYTNASQYLLPLVDGVISVSSSVGLQALLWGKPIISVWESHLKLFSPINKIEDISEFILEEYDPKQNDAILYYLLTRYYLTEKYAYDKTYFSNWLEKAVTKKLKNEIDFSFFEKIQKNNLKDILSELRIEDMENLIAKDEQKSIDLEVTKEKKVNFSRNVKEECFRLILNHDIVSFDIFDTLLVRPFRLPHEMFLFMQNKVREILNDQSFEFHKLRRLAEHLERKSSQFNEVTIDEIYKRLNLILDYRLSEIDIEKLKYLEIEMEFKFCSPRNFVKELFDFALSLNKRIIIVSDFYIQGNILEKLLSNNGYLGYERLYVSCNVRRTKLKGDLFSFVMKDMHLEGSAFIHFGDNRVSDIVNAVKYGWSSREIGKPSGLLSKNRQHSNIWNNTWNRTVFQSNEHQVSLSIYFGLISNKLYDNPANLQNTSLVEGNAIDLGYVLFGPLLFGFVKHILVEGKKNNIKVFYFLSRDGWIIKQAYDLLTKYDKNAPQSKYLYTSRKAYLLGTIDSEETFLKTLDTPFSPTSIRFILERRYKVTDIDFISHEMLEQCGLDDIDQIVHPIHQLVYLKELFKRIYPYLEEHFMNMRLGCISYLTSEGLFGKKKKAVVDIGYAGSIQKIMIGLGAKNLNGYYFLTHSKAEKLEVEDNVIVNGYLAQRIDHQDTNNDYTNYVFLFETIFSHISASLSHFSFDKNIHKLIFEQSRSSYRRKDTITSFQYGALDFIKDILVIYKGNFKEIYYSTDVSSKVIYSFLKKPSYLDAKIFENIEFDDSFSGKKKLYLINEISDTLKSGKIYNKNLIKKLYETSLWKEGASIILSVEGKKLPRKRIKNLKKVNIKKVPIQKNKKKYLNKLKNNPYLFFYDSKKSYLRPLRYLFKRL